MGATRALVTVKKGGLLVYFNTIESVGSLLDRLFLSVGAELEDAVDDDVVARADLVTTALAAHRSCNVLAGAAKHNLGLATQAAAHQLTPKEVSALRSIRRKANFAKHVWDAPQLPGESSSLVGMASGATVAAKDIVAGDTCTATAKECRHGLSGPRPGTPASDGASSATSAGESQGDILKLTTGLTVCEAVTEGVATSVGLARGDIQKPNMQHSVGGAATDGDATDHSVGVEASDGDATSAGAAQGDIQKPITDRSGRDVIAEGVAASAGVAQGDIKKPATMYSEGDAVTGVDFTSAGQAQGNTRMLSTGLTEGVAVPVGMAQGDIMKPTARHSMGGAAPDPPDDTIPAVKRQRILRNLRAVDAIDKKLKQPRGLTEELIAHLERQRAALLRGNEILRGVARSGA
jgi:hypothetical protein